MPLSADVSTFTLTFGPYTDAAGAIQSVGITGTLTPVDATGKPITVLHAGDGSVIVPAAIPVTVENNGTATVIGLAHTDDTHLTPQNFLYQMTWNVPLFRLTLVNKTFAVPTAAGATVDYDLLQPDGGSTPLVYVPLVVTSVNGHTGAVTLAASDVGADTAGAAGAAQTASLQKSANLSDVASASTARTNLGLGSAATQASSAFDTSGAAAAAQAASLPLQRIATTVTASGALVANQHNPVDATAGALTVTLPTGQAEGATISVEKTDATTNAVAVTGSIRGVAATTINLVWQNEDLQLRADSSGSWWPIAGHKTKASLDAAYRTNYGAAASRPDPTTVPDAALYLSTDISGGKLQQVHAGAWTNVAAPYSHGKTQHLPWESDPIALNADLGLPVFTVPQVGSSGNISTGQPYLYGDAVHDDAPAINYAIQQANAAGGGIVYLPVGTWYCFSTVFLGFLPAAVPSSWTTANTPTAQADGDALPSTKTTRVNVNLVGGGMFATKLVRGATFDGVLLDVSGAAGTDNSIGNFARRLGLRDVTLDGGMTIGNTSVKPVLRHYYASINSIQRVTAQNACGEGWRIVQSWDSEVYHFRVDNCGGYTTAAGGTTTTPNATPTTPAVRVLNQAPGTTSGQFGYAADSTNNWHFYDLTIESYRDGAIWIDGSGGYWNGCNGLLFSGLKMDSTLVNGPSLVITGGLGGNYNVQRANSNITISGLVVVPGVPQTGGGTPPWPAVTIQDTVGLNVRSALIGPQSTSMNYGVQFGGNNTGLVIDGLGFSRGGGSGVLALLNFASGQNDVDILSWGLQNMGGSIALIAGAPTSGQIARPYINTFGGSGTNESNNGNLYGGRGLVVPSGNAGDWIAQPGDTFPRGQRKADGSVNLGPGSSATDSALTRAAAGVFGVGNALTVAGLTGATAASRYVGATTSGAPATGTFAVGDWVIDRSGAIWVCTAAGTPGTWVKPGASPLTVQDASGNPVTQRGTVEFTGSAVASVADDSANSRTVVTLTASGGASGLAAGWLGDGSDGTVLMDGTNTFASFASKSGNTYTLIRDVLASSITVNAGVTLKTGGYRILCSGTFTNNGTVTNSGANATGATAGSSSGGSLSAAGNGGNGTTGNGAAGSTSATSLGGSGGSGGAGGTGTAGGAGTATAPGAFQGGLQQMRFMPAAAMGSGLSAGVVVTLRPGGGGGGGGGDGTNSGGGGGAGGGSMVIVTKTWANNGTVSANGGNGANGVAGNAGGGGSGGGGFVIITTTSSSGAGTVTATAGTPGSGVGTGSVGSAGVSGNTVINLFS